MKLKRKEMIMIMINILLLKNLSESSYARLKQANLASKNNIVDFVKKTDFDDKLKIAIKKSLQIKQNI